MSRRVATRHELHAVFRRAQARDLNREEMIMTQHGRRWGLASRFVIVAWLLVSLLYLLGVPVYAAERLVPYDDFNATHIDPDKWVGIEFGPEPRGPRAVHGAGYRSAEHPSQAVGRSASRPQLYRNATADGFHRGVV
jgi:hypothetical protein